MKIRFIFIPVIAVLIIFCTGCKSNAVQEDTYNYPNTITGQVTDNTGRPLKDAKLSLSTAPDVQAVWSNSDGIFNIQNVPSGKHKLLVEKLGFETFETDVPSAVNGTSTVNLVLKKRIYVIPVEKPLSTGPVRIRNKELETDFDGDGNYTNYQVKGVAFSPAPIGTYGSGDDAVINQSMKYLTALHVNTIRTYSVAGKYLLQKAAENNIHVIVGYWVNTNLDLSDNSIRNSVIDGFAKMVTDLKDYPAVLIWNLGNEQNYVNGNNPYWYSLVQELAITAYKIEGIKYHPVCASNGNVFNIGNAAMKADDSSLSYMDLWGSNAYQLNFTNFFNKFRTLSSKPIVITEFGIDALDNRTKTEYPMVQAYYDSTNWVQITAASDVCVGGTVFEFTDEWWKDSNGDPYKHDYGGYPTNQHPDGYSNEEWWGLISISPDNNSDGLDEWNPRKVYYMFQKVWKE